MDILLQSIGIVAGLALMIVAFLGEIKDHESLKTAVFILGMALFFGCSYWVFNAIGVTEEMVMILLSVELILLLYFSGHLQGYLNKRKKEKTVPPDHEGRLPLDRG